MTPNEILQQALSLASIGLRVIPAHLDRKSPVGKKWALRASSDPDTVSGLFRGKRLWNIAVVGGVGWVIIDLDRKNGVDGLESLEKLAKEHGEAIPETWTVHTPSGGLHLYFRCEGDRLGNWVKVLPGVDIRGKGGCVIAPPSVITGAGCYTWDDLKCPVFINAAMLPAWLESALIAAHGVQESAKQAAKEYAGAAECDIEEDGPDIGEGGRNQALFDIASRLWGYGLVSGKDELLKRLRATNKNRCKPPLDDSEVTRTADSACDNPEYPRGWRHTEAWEDFADLEEKIPPGAKFIPPSYNEIGVAALMVQLFKNELTYCPNRGWFMWDGQKWVEDENAARNAAVKLVNAMTAQAKQELATAKEEADRAQALAFQKFCRGIGNNSKLSGVCKIAQGGLSVNALDFDSDPYSLNTPGGLYDLRTGMVSPLNPKALCTKITLKTPGPNGIDMWQSFLDTVTCKDEDLKRYLQYCAGMALYGKVFHEGILICYGGGSNGKSTLFNTLSACLGTYSGVFPSECLMTRGANRFATSSLEGKRLSIAKELKKGEILDPGALKNAASTDPIRIEHKGRDGYDIIPTHTLILYTNPLPKLEAVDFGTRRRITCIPFNAKITDVITDYGERLKETAGPAILQWAIDGAKLFAANGFDLPAPPAAVANATKDYFSEESWIDHFLEDRCSLSAKGKAQVQTAYNAYISWCIDSGETHLSRNDFSSSLKEYGFNTCKENHGRTYFIGFELNPAEGEFGEVGEVKNN